MQCNICSAEVHPNARFCSSCGSPIEPCAEDAQIIETAFAEAQAVFESEVGDIPDQGDASVQRKSARDRLKEMGSAVRKGTDGAIKFGKRVGDGTSRAIDTTKKVSSDVSKRVGSAIEATKDFGGEVAVTAKKVGEGTGKAVKRTKETIQDLGQVGVIITQRALDVVRASLRAVEIVDQYLVDQDSNYEVGNFITGVGVPPYLELEFTKRSDDITSEEKRLIQAIRTAGLSCSAIGQALEATVQSHAAQGEQPADKPSDEGSRNSTEGDP